MVEFKFGDIVLLKFPFTDGFSYKKRPALIMKDLDDGDVIACRITSKIYDTPFDVNVKNWSKYGLKLPSVIRVHKIASLEKTLIDQKIGQLDKSTQNQIKKIFKKLL